MAGPGIDAGTNGGGGGGGGGGGVIEALKSSKSATANF